MEHCTQYAHDIHPQAAPGNGPERYDCIKNTTTEGARQALQAHAGGPPTMPRAALEAALELAELSDRNGWGLALVPGFADESTRPWAKADRSRADVLRHRGSWSRAVDVRDVSGMLLDLDVDDPSTEGLAAELAAGGATFAYASRRGQHRVYWRRDLVPAEHRGNMVHDPARPSEALAPGLDVVLGSIRLWSADRPWLTDPATIADPPQALRERIAACWAARQARIAQADAEAQERREAAERRRREREAQDLEEERGRLDSWARAALEGILRDVAGLAHGRRALDVYRLAARAGSLAAAHWSGLTEAEAEAALLGAATACGLTEREALGHVRRGLRAGMAAPMPEPADRSLPSRGGGAQTGAEREELERQAEAAASSVGLARDAGILAGVHKARIASAEALAEALARRMLREGRTTVTVGLGQLGIDADRGRSAIRSAASVLEACGWRLEPGGIGADGTPRASSWTFGQDRPACSLNEGRCLQGHPDPSDCRHALSGAILSESRQDGLAGAWRRPVGLLERGLRRQILLHLEEALRACGPSSRRTVSALLQVEEGATAVELAEVTGLSSRTVDRHLAIFAERGLVTSSTRPTAGRPARACALTAEARAAALGETVADPSPILAATLQAGAERLRRAEAQLAAERSLLEDARRVAEVAGVPVAVAAQAWREQIQHRARAERDRTLAGLESPLIADARRREGRVSMALAQARVAVAQLRACWAMGAPLPPAVTA